MLPSNESGRTSRREGGVRAIAIDKRLHNNKNFDPEHILKNEN